MIRLLFYLLCFFPFVKLIPIGMNLDTQPWAVLFSVLYVIVFMIVQCGNVKFPWCYLYLVALACTNVAFVIVFYKFLPYNMMLNDKFDFYVIMRNLVSIVSMAYITLASYIVHKRYGFSEKICKIIINVWFVTGLIQKFVIPEFAYSLIANARTSANRGVLGYASEPAFYGYMCLLMLLFVYDFKKNKYIYFVNIMVQLIVFAESSNGLLLFSFLFLFFILKVISLTPIKKTGKLIGIGILVMIGAWKVAKQIPIIFSGKRIGTFLNIMLSDIALKDKTALLLQDRSIAVRLGNITKPLSAFMEDFGLPHGLMTVRDVSGFSGWLFQYGIGGLLLVILLFLIIRKGYSKNEAGRSFAYSFVAIMTIGIQVTNPTIWFYVGYCMSRKICRKEGIITGGYFNILCSMITKR